ncbi:MAG: hypothetical protein QW756_05505 [Nitrososphaerota archaeon]
MAEDGVYERLLSLWMRERSSVKLNKLPEEMLKEVSSHVSNLRRQQKLSERGSINSVLRGSEIIMIQRLLDSLFRLRLGKIIRSGISEIPTENMLPFERRYVNTITRAAQEHSYTTRTILTNLQLLQHRKESRYEVVVFLKSFPKIVGEDLVSYGPFSEGDLATIPVENASLLASKNVVKLVRLV